jgi:hypothetical protein
MTHRLGSVLPASPPVSLGPGASIITFSPPPAAGGTKFLMLRFTNSSLSGDARVEVDLGYATDVFTTADGSAFWSRPVAGNAVTVRFVPGTGGGAVTLAQYGRGEGMADGGATNTNADLFLLSSPYAEPTYSNPAGVCPNGSAPSWENVAVLPPGLMADVARSVGMFVIVDGDHLSSCSAALIGSDLILTAGHCVSADDEARTGSFTLDYQTDAAGGRLPGYNPHFHKLRRVVKTGMARAVPVDYSVVQVESPPGGFGAPPLTIRPGLPAVGEELFVIHHPRGVVKKVSRKPADPTCQVLSTSTSNGLVTITYACDSDNGSSGSPVIDMMGRIVAVNDWAPGACSNAGQSSATILKDFLTEPPPARPVDVMLVLDRSGSMSLPSGNSASTKIEDARRAAALFLDLLRTGAGHKAGIVSFSTSTTLDADLADHTPARKTALIGPGPAHNAGIVGAITPNGFTTIGGGLDAARLRFPPPGPAANTPAVLLMTDGLENTPPMINDVDSMLGGIRLNVIGFGTPASLDGPRLTDLARRHGGLYTRAGTGLDLNKYFVLAFGNIFESGISTDPAREVPAGRWEADPVPVQVCGETSMTVVVGWNDPSIELVVSLRTPSGATLQENSAGIDASSGGTWHFLRVQMPIAGEQDGTWQAVVGRRSVIPNVERAAAVLLDLPAAPFFLAVVVDGGPWLRAEPPARAVYTGDTVNPLVRLLQPDGQKVPADVVVEVTRPARGAGELLTAARLGNPTDVGGEPLDGRTATLVRLETEAGEPLGGQVVETYTLTDDPAHTGGPFEPDGRFGLLLPELATVEGDYTFHARATYGADCTGTREAFWSLHVDVGIDPGQTILTVEDRGAQPDGMHLVDVRITPRDRYGNHLGPGRSGALEVSGTPGTQSAGSLVDNGDGTYTQPGRWDPASGSPPGVVIGQPGRPPVVVTPGQGRGRAGCLRWVLVALLVALVILLLVLLMIS